MYSRIVSEGKTSIVSKLVMVRKTTFQCYDVGNYCVMQKNYVIQRNTIETEK
jgi:hypothetical protein